MGDSRQRSPWLVTLLVAVIGALGLVGAAVLPGLIDDGSSDSGASPETSTAASAPNIAGDYYMDAGPRVIAIEGAGTGSYDMSEPEGPWPFTGRVTWDGTRFVGPARFDSGVEMSVTLRPIGQGKLAAAFDFVAEDRIDRHTLSPVA